MVKLNRKGTHQSVLNGAPRDGWNRKQGCCAQHGGCKGPCVTAQIPTGLGTSTVMYKDTGPGDMYGIRVTVERGRVERS